MGNVNIVLIYETYQQLDTTWLTNLVSLFSQPEVNFLPLKTTFSGSLKKKIKENKKMIDDEVTVNKKFKETIIVLNFKSQALFITKEKNK